MKIELPVRWAETGGLGDDGLDAKTRRIIHGDEDDGLSTNTIYSYDYMVLDTDDIKLFHRYDDEHFILKNYDGDGYCIHLSYDGFKELYEDLTGTRIAVVRPMPSLTIKEDEENQD